MILEWKQQFETFEKYADRLSDEANDLKAKFERDRREATRLSSSEHKLFLPGNFDMVTVANEQSRHNATLEEKLRNTETARAEAMRQLSDMHTSYVDTLLR